MIVNHDQFTQLTGFDDRACRAILRTVALNMPNLKQNMMTLTCLYDPLA